MVSSAILVFVILAKVKVPFPSWIIPELLSKLLGCLGQLYLHRARCV